MVVLGGCANFTDVKLNHYWSRDISFRKHAFSATETLPRDRFLFILKYLRFSDPCDLIEGDYLARIRPFLKKVNDLCQNTYLPNKEITVDETLMLL